MSLYHCFTLFTTTLLLQASCKRSPRKHAHKPTHTHTHTHALYITAIQLIIVFNTNTSERLNLHTSHQVECQPVPRELRASATVSLPHQSTDYLAVLKCVHRLKTKTLMSDHKRHKHTCSRSTLICTRVSLRYLHGLFALTNSVKLTAHKRCFSFPVMRRSLKQPSFVATLRAHNRVYIPGPGECLRQSRQINCCSRKCNSKPTISTSQTKPEPCYNTCTQLYIFL